MRSLLFFVIFALESCAVCYAQTPAKTATTSTAPASGSVIIYNNKQSYNPDNQTFPIDRPFPLEIDSIPSNNLFGIYVYETQMIGGVRQLKDKTDKLNPANNYRPSFKFDPSQITVVGNTITLQFPPIKPEKEFDISVIKQFSQKNLNRALTLNEYLDSRYLPDLAPGADPVRLAAEQKNVTGQFKTLLDSVNDRKNYGAYNLNYLVARQNGQEYEPDGVPIWIGNIDAYRTYFLDPLRSQYNKLVHTQPKINPASPADDDLFWAHGFYSQPEIKRIFLTIPSHSPVYYRLFILQKMFDCGRFNDVLTGRIRIDTTGLDKWVSPYDFAGRSANITHSYKYLDSVYDALSPFEATGPADIAALAAKTKTFLGDLIQNKKYVDKYAKQITDYITANSTENIWAVGQTTNSPDLITFGSRRLAINAGIATIFAYDNYGKIACIPKFFLGIDYHFKSYDKTADFSQAKPVPPETSGQSHDLEASSGFLDRFSLTAGITFGAMTNPDFNNTYGTFSFLFGPSYRIGKYVKFSAGAALLHRFDTNPLLASTDHLIAAPYASISIDYDLLNVVSGITTSLFK